MECNDKRECFARGRYNPKQCTILNRTYPDGECKFRKSPQEFEEGLKRYPPKYPLNER